MAEGLFMHEGDKSVGMSFLSTRRNHARMAYAIYLMGLEAALERAGLKPLDFNSRPMIHAVGRGCAKLKLTRNVFRWPGRRVFAAIHWGSDSTLFPTCYIKETIVYCFDCWPDKYAQWEALFRRQRVQTAFFTARASAEHFGRLMPRMECHWLPEATDPGFYRHDRELSHRRIAVLEYGRRYEPYHQRIVEALARHNHAHLYEASPGQVVCATRQEFLDAIADSRIAICFPSSMTYPERRDCETATYRFFESIAARCLIVGHCPAELQDLFGYNPLIEAEAGDPADQMLEVLGHIENYQELVNRNFARLLQVGTWDVRVRQMLAVVRGNQGNPVPTKLEGR